MPSPPPFNPYEQTSPQAQPPASLGERVAVLETNHRHLHGAVQEVKHQSAGLWAHVASMERAGAEAVKSLPGIISTATLPLQERLAKLETRWWEPIRPYLGRIYVAGILLAFAFGWKRVTGEPLPVRIWLELIVKSIFS
jgi:hypothetical protein